MKFRTITILCFGSYAILYFLTKYNYEADLPGVPDAGLLPVAELPLFFWVYRTGEMTLGSDAHFLAAWILACLVYLIPPALAFYLSKTFKERLWSCLLTGLIFLHACYSMFKILQPKGEFVYYFFTAPAAKECALVIFMLLFLSACAGILLQYLRDR